MLGERAAEDVRRVDQLRGLLATEDAPLVGEPEAGGDRALPADPCQLGGGAGKREEPFVSKVAVDALGVDHPGDLAHGRVHLLLEAYGAAVR